MIYDANTWIGRWPFQSYPHTSAADLLRQMDRHGIAKALVASLHGLFYKDAHESNRELAAEVRRHRDRLFPCALINPTYGGWRQDLRQCREEFGMPALRLAPDYYGHTLRDRCAEELVAAAHELKMRVAIHYRIVDSRGRHRLDPGREADRREVAAFVRKFPRASFLLLSFNSLLEEKPPAQPECCYDIAEFFGRNGLRLEREIRKHGARRFLFGSTLLLRPGRPATLALEACRLPRAQREAIAWKNLARLVPEMK